MNFGWIGAATDDGFTAAVDVTGPVDIRLAVSLSSDMSSPTFSSMITGADGWNKLSITGLSANTVYWWALEEGGVLGSAEGAIRTFPTAGAVQNFTIAAASCCRSGTSPNTFTRIKDRAPAFFMHMGDFHYEDINVNSTAAFETAYELTLGQASQADLYKNIPIFYVWDDHDYGTNNSDGSAISRPAALTSYRTHVPHPPLAFSGPDNDTPITNTWVCGRVRFVQLDIRSEADFSPGDPSLNSLIGTTQLNWLTNLIETFTEPLMVIDVSVPWIIPVGEKVDTWGNATTERTAISDAIQTHAPGRVLLIHGDSHMLAMDDGSNSNYATSPSGPGPRVCCFAPLNQSNSVKGGPYSEGVHTDSETQYGVLEFTDTGSAITVAAKGINAVDESVVVSMTWKVGDGAASDQIIYWAQDVTEADAFPADTAAFVRTDGPNPTRVRLNGEWWNINTITRDGVAHTLNNTSRTPIDGHDEWKKGVGSVTIQAGELETRPRLRANASTQGSWRFDNVSVLHNGVEAITNGDFETGDKTGWDSESSQAGTIEQVNGATNPPQTYVMRIDTAGTDQDQDANRFSSTGGDTLDATFWASPVGNPDDIGRLSVSFLDGTGGFLRFETFAEVPVHGSQIRVSRATVSGSGTVSSGTTKTGSGVLQAQQATVSGTGEREVTSTGALQAQQATVSGSGGPVTPSGITHVGTETAFDEATSNTLTVAKPSGVQEGDLILAHICQDSNDPLGVPTGFTELDNTNINDAAGVSAAIGYKIATGSEPSSYAFTKDDSEDGVAAIIVFRGVDTDTPLDATPVFESELSDSTFVITAPSITTVTDGAAVVSFYGYEDGGVTVTDPPSGMEVAWDATAGSGGSGASLAGAWGVQSTAGSSGTKDFTISVDGANDPYRIGTLALRPDPGANGSGALQAQTATVSGSGTLAREGSGVLQAQTAVVAGTATREVTGSGALQAQMATVSGTATREVTGSGVLQAQAATVSGTATREVTAAGALQGQQATVSGAGTLVREGSGALQAQAAATAGVGTLAREGSGALQAQRVTVTGFGGEGIFGAGDLQAQRATVSGEGFREITSDGSLQADPAQVAGQASREVTATGTLQAQTAQITGDGRNFKTATGALKAQPAAVSATVKTGKVGSGALQAGAAQIDATVVRTITVAVALRAGNARIEADATGLGAFSFQLAPVTTSGHLPAEGKLRPLVFTDRADGQTYIILHDGGILARLEAFTPRFFDELFPAFEEPTMRVGDTFVRVYVENATLLFERYPFDVYKRPILFGQVARPRPHQPRYQLILPESKLN